MRGCVDGSLIRSTTYAALWGSGILASTLLMSPAPKPVYARLCFGRVKPGPTGPVIREATGAPIEGLRSRGGRSAAGGVAMMMVMMEIEMKNQNKQVKTVDSQATKLS